MLMIGTRELAQRLYDAWRTEEIVIMGSTYLEPQSWVVLSAQHKAQWCKVAEAAGRAIADALSSEPAKTGG